MRRRTRFAALVAGLSAVGLSLVGLVAAVPVGTASSSATALNSVTYDDRIGDSGTAPDVSTVVVSNDDAGMLSIAITFPNRTAFAGTDYLDVDFNTDGDLATGEWPGGSDYGIEYFSGGRILEWRYDEDEEDWVQTPMKTLTSMWSASTLTLKLSATDLASTRRFTFLVYTDANPDNRNAPFDWAPDEGTPPWVYEVKLPAPTLAVKSLDCTPEPARAGKLMTGKAVVAVTRAGMPEVLAPTAKVTWRATFANVRLRPLSTTRAGGTLRSTWKLPTTVKAKVVRITLTITSDGVTVTKTHLHRVVR